MPLEYSVPFNSTFQSRSFFGSLQRVFLNNGTTLQDLGFGGRSKKSHIMKHNLIYHVSTWPDKYK